MSLCKPKLIAKPGELTAKDRMRLEVMHLVCFGSDCDYPDWDNHYWWTIRDGEHTVGFASMQLSEGQHEDTIGLFTRVGVLPEWRGRGIQSKLIQSRITYAKRNSCTRCCTYTIENPASDNSLITCGFRRYDPEDPYAGPATYWQLTLEGTVDA